MTNTEAYYKISRSSLEAIADETRSLSRVASPMTPAQIAKQLRRVPVLLCEDGLCVIDTMEFLTSTAEGAVMES